MSRRQRPPPPPPANPLDGMVDSPDECGSYPKFLYYIRYMHHKDLYIDSTYQTLAKAEFKVARLFGEGVSHDLQIVKSTMLTCKPLV